MAETFYQKELKKVLQGPYANDYKQVLDDKGRPIGNSFVGVTVKKVRDPSHKSPFQPIKKPELKKTCPNCEEEFKWDHKHSRKDFEARRFCSNKCKKLYFSTPHETMQNVSSSNP